MQGKRNTDYSDAEGLEYSLSDDGTHYVVVGIGACTAAEIAVAGECKRLPVTRIVSRAFENCRVIKSITIPDSVTSIEEAAFCCCVGLKSITISNSVLIIEDGVFVGCRSLKSVIIPSGVIRIGDSAFDGCKSLELITISSSLKSIGNGAFDGCSKLKSIRFQGSKEEWRAIEKESAWNNWTGNYTVCCTNGKLDKEGNEIE